MRKRYLAGLGWALWALCAIVAAVPMRAQNTTTFGTIVSQGTPCGAANCVYYQLPPGTPWVTVTVTGTWSGTLEAATTSAPNANYSNLSTIAWTALGTETANGTWSVGTSGATYLRVRATAWTSGSALVQMARSLVGAPLVNPILNGTATASGLQAPVGGSASNCWLTNGGQGACVGGCTGGNCIVSNPTGSQTITQPGYTNFTLNNGIDSILTFGTQNSSNQIFLYGSQMNLGSAVGAGNTTIYQNFYNGSVDFEAGARITVHPGQGGGGSGGNPFPSEFAIQRGISYATRAVPTGGTLNYNDYAALVSGGENVLLPSNSTYILDTGQTYWVVGPTTTTAFTVTAQGTALIENGSGTLVSTYSGSGWAIFLYDGTNWQVTAPGSGGVSQIVAGTNVTISPSGGTGTVTINASGGGGLPTATAAGQSISSTAAGTAYAVQPQVYYSQAGDTIASIETECSSACTYVVTAPQTITLTASHTLSANVNLLFYQGGAWTVNGAGFVLTVPAQVQGALSTHFPAGTGSVKLGAGTSRVPVEWFGAVGDWNGSTGTDNSAAIQAAISSLTAGVAVLQAEAYKISSALSVAASQVGMVGTVYGSNSNAAPNGTSVLVQTTAASDTIDCNNAATTPSASIRNNVFRDFQMQRTVLPSGTATGLKLNFCAGATVERVTSMDSTRGFYFQGAPSAGNGAYRDDQAAWGYTGLSYSTPVYGFYVDSSNGYGMSSAVFENDSVSYPSGSTNIALGYGFYVYGTHPADVFFDLSGCTYLSYCAYIDDTGSSGGNFDDDIHFNRSIFDACTVTCFYVTGIEGGPNGLDIDGGFFAIIQGVTGSAFDIESSQQVHIQHVTVSIAPGLGSNAGNAIQLVSSDYSSVQNSDIVLATDNASDAISLSGTSDSVVTGNFLYLQSTGGGGSATGSDIAVASGSYNAISGNVLDGQSAHGISYDSVSDNNAYAQLNPFPGTYSGTAILDAGTGNQLKAALTQISTVTGCNFASSAANLTCSNSVTLPTAMPDTSYTVSCVEYTNFASYPASCGPVLQVIEPVSITSTTGYSFTEVTQGSSCAFTTLPNYAKTYVCTASHP